MRSVHALSTAVFLLYFLINCSSCQKCVIQTNVFDYWENMCECVLIAKNIGLMTTNECVQINQPEDYRLKYNDIVSFIKVLIADNNKFTISVTDKDFDIKNSTIFQTNLMDLENNGISKAEVCDVIEQADNYLNMRLHVDEC